MTVDRCKVTCAEVPAPAFLSLTREIMVDKQMVYGVDVSKATLVVGVTSSAAPVEIGNAAEPLATWLASIPAGSVVAMEATGV